MSEWDAIDGGERPAILSDIAIIVKDLLARAQAAEARADKAERELKAAIGALVGQCKYCRKNEECTTRKGPHIYCWEWIGVKEEE